MSNPITDPVAVFIDPDLITLARLRLANNLGRCLLLPGELRVITTILDALHTADEALTAVGVADEHTFATLVGHHLALIDTYRRTMAQVQAPRPPGARLRDVSASRRPGGCRGRLLDQLRLRADLDDVERELTS